MTLWSSTSEGQNQASDTFSYLPINATRRCGISLKPLVRFRHYAAKWTAKSQSSQGDFGPVSKDVNRSDHRHISISARHDFLVDNEIPRNNHFAAVAGEHLFQKLFWRRRLGAQRWPKHNRSMVDDQ